MLKTGPFVAGAFAGLLFASALRAPDASAEAPNCMNKANKYVACTDKLKGKKAEPTTRRKLYSGPVSRFSAGSRSRQ